MALAKPYVVKGPLTNVDVERIDRMLDELYRQGASAVTSTGTGSTGTGSTGAGLTNAQIAARVLLDTGGGGTAGGGAGGATGAIGSQGPPGPQGDDGADGEPGAPGVSGSFLFSNRFVATLPAVQDDLNPGFKSSMILKLTASGAGGSTLNGVVAAQDGSVMTITNVGATGDITIGVFKSSSSVGNRFWNGALATGTFVIPVTGPIPSVMFYYDALIGVWVRLTV